MTFNNIAQSIGQGVGKLQQTIYNSTQDLPPVVSETLNVALPVIALISSIWGSGLLTGCILVGTLAANIVAPHIVRNVASARVFIVVGGSLAVTKLLIPFGKVLACVAASAFLCYAGYDYKGFKATIFECFR